MDGDDSKDKAMDGDDNTDKTMDGDNSNDNTMDGDDSKDKTMDGDDSEDKTMDGDDSKDDMSKQAENVPPTPEELEAKRRRVIEEYIREKNEEVARQCGERYRGSITEDNIDLDYLFRLHPAFKDQPLNDVEMGTAAENEPSTSGQQTGARRRLQFEEFPRSHQNLIEGILEANRRYISTMSGQGTRFTDCCPEIPPHWSFSRYRENNDLSDDEFPLFFEPPLSSSDDVPSGCSSDGDEDIEGNVCRPDAQTQTSPPSEYQTTEECSMTEDVLSSLFGAIVNFGGSSSDSKTEDTTITKDNSPESQLRTGSIHNPSPVTGNALSRLTVPDERFHSSVVSRLSDDAVKSADSTPGSMPLNRSSSSRDDSFQANFSASDKNVEKFDVSDFDDDSPGSKAGVTERKRKKPITYFQSDSEDENCNNPKAAADGGDGSDGPGFKYYKKIKMHQESSNSEDEIYNNPRVGGGGDGADGSGIKSYKKINQGSNSDIESEEVTSPSSQKSPTSGTSRDTLKRQISIVELPEEVEESSKERKKLKKGKLN